MNPIFGEFANCFYQKTALRYLEMFRTIRRADFLAIQIIVVIFVVSLTAQNVYATNLAYEEKVRANLDIEFIKSDLTSVFYNILNQDYQIAQVQLEHAIAKDNKIFDTFHSENCNNMEHALSMLHHISPQKNDNGANDVFSYVFEKINKCKSDIVEESLSENIHYNVEVITRLLESARDEYTASDSLSDTDKMLKKQQSLGLAVRAHMMATTQNIEDPLIEENFQKLFFMYYSNEDSRDIAIHIQIIIKNLEDVLVSDGMKGFAVMLHPKKDSEMFLKTTEYSSNHMLVELYGENFEKNKNMTIEYISPHTKNLQKIIIQTDHKGEFSFPLEIVQNKSKESYFFAIQNGETTSYKLLTT